MPILARRSIRLLPLAVAVGLALSACGSGNDNSTATSAPPSVAESTPAGATPTGSAGVSGSLDQNGIDACNKVNQAAQVTGDDAVSKAQRAQLLLQAADSARQSSVPQIKDVQSLVSGAVSGSGGDALDRVRNICTGLGWSPS